MSPEIPLTEQFALDSQHLRRLPHKLYKQKLNLGAMGINATLFKCCRFNASNKLAIRQVAEVTLSQAAEVIALIFECDPWESRIARVDFAVDLPGMTMAWVRTHIRVRGKRSYREHKPKQNAKSEAQRGFSVYMGRGHDVYRFYDKTSELFSYGRSAGVAAELRDQITVTRIQRQLRTSSIPDEISTLEDLQLNASDFNPFRAINFVTGGESEPRIQDHPVTVYLQGIGLRMMVEKLGLARTWTVVNRRSGGNAARVFARFAPFISSGSEHFVMPDLFGLHRSSIWRQLEPDRIDDGGPFLVRG